MSDDINVQRVISSLHEPRQYGITRRAEWAWLVAHLRTEHGYNTGRPKPFRSLLDAMHLQQRHDDMHPEIERLVPAGKR